MLTKYLTEDFKLNIHFTTSYCPWVSRTVERVCREVVRAVRAMLSEMKLPQTHWPGIVAFVQSVLNHAPFKRLGEKREEDSYNFRSPFEVFNSDRPKRPLLRALPILRYTTMETISELRGWHLIGIWEDIHKDTLKESEKQMSAQTPPQQWYKCTMV